MTTKEVQGVLYDILVDIHEFCVANGIKYSLAGGTLLGAIRHNGFIPWDNDMDIQFSRPEYERFIHTYKSQRGFRLFSSEINREEFVGIAFTRVCEMTKTYADNGIQPWINRETGVYVDIMPIDGAPNDYVTAKKKINKMYRNWRILNLYRSKLVAKTIRKFTLGQMFVYKIKRFLSHLIPKSYMQKYIDQCMEYSYNSNSYLANFSTMKNKLKEWQPKDSMANYVLHTFENGRFYIMEGYETSLVSLYGDYMKLPPLDKQKGDESVCFYWKE